VGRLHVFGFRWATKSRSLTVAALYDSQIDTEPRTSVSGHFNQPVPTTFKRSCPFGRSIRWSGAQYLPWAYGIAHKSYYLVRISNDFMTEVLELTARMSHVAALLGNWTHGRTFPVAREASTVTQAHASVISFSLNAIRPPDSLSEFSAREWALRQIAKRGEPSGGGRSVEIL
jgi:hypothetical protein